MYSYQLGQGKELLLEGISSTYVNANADWRKNGEDYYVLSGSFFVVLTQNGELNYRIVLGQEKRLQGICITESGRIVVAIYNRDNDNTQLMELDTKTHELVEKDIVQIYYGMSGDAKDSVMVMSEEGLCSIDIVSNEKSWYMKWKGTTYDPNREELANPSILDVVNYEGIYTTEEQVAQIRKLLENASQDPIRTEYVWSIISEETESYFSGEKTIEQVTEIIENRVSMYLAENT